MNSRELHKLVSKTARRSWVLAALLALSLASVTSTNAQTNGASPAATAKAQQISAATSARPMKAEPRKGAEGIQVHGHWVIEVKNPDGKLVKHVEFENSLDPGFSLPSSVFPGGSASIPGGNSYLPALMDGQAVAPSGSWAILLSGSNGMNTLATASAPCLGALNYGIEATTQSTTQASSTVGACLLAQNTLAGQNLGCPVLAGASPHPGLSCNLSAAPTTVTISTSSGPATIPAVQLSGSITATVSGSVSTVATLISNPCALFTAQAVSNCFISPAVSGGTVFDVLINSFTSSTNFPGAPISVSSGQTLSVNVTISFQ